MHRPRTVVRNGSASSSRPTLRASFAGSATIPAKPAFAWEVDRVRRQLAPIVSRRALASSFAREAFRTAGASAAGAIRGTGSIGPVHCAYAVRWLELGDGAPRPGWSGFVAGRD